MEMHPIPLYMRRLGWPLGVVGWEERAYNWAMRAGALGGSDQVGALVVVTKSKGG